jgi:hypothetical protein
LLSLIWDQESDLFKETETTACWELEESQNLQNATDVVKDSGTFKAIYENAVLNAINLSQSAMAETKEKVEREAKIKINDITNYRNVALDFYKRRIKQSENRLRILSAIDKTEKESIKQNIGRDKAVVKRLTQKTDEGLSRLQLESQLTYEAPECIALAIIVPSTDAKKTAKEKTSEGKARIEKAGMESVMKYERQAGRKPVDVSLTFKGYDIMSNGNNEKRFIEVKSFANSGPIELTVNEWIVSEKLAAEYWLYIVENVEKEEKRKITIINNPSKVFQDIVQKIPILQFKMLIRDWQNFIEN